MLETGNRANTTEPTKQSGSRKKGRAELLFIENTVTHTSIANARECAVSLHH